MEKHVIEGEADESDSESDRQVIATVCKPLPIETLTKAEPAPSSYVVSGEAEESDEDEKKLKKFKRKVRDENSGNAQHHNSIPTQPQPTQRELLRHQCLLQMRLWECNVMLHHSARAITDTTAAHNRRRLSHTATMLLQTQENIRGAANNLRAANAKLGSSYFELKSGLASNVLANVRIQ